MLFNSYSFLLFLLISFILYYLPAKRFKNQNWQIGLLIVASLFFYGYSQFQLIFLLLFSVVINIISSYAVVYGKPSLSRLYAVTGVILNLSISSINIV